MLNLLKICIPPPSSSAEESEDAQARALETLEALNNVFGGLTLAPAAKVETERRSASEWSTELDQPTSEVLAEPAECPPCNTDPSTVVIFHQGGLELESASSSCDSSSSTSTTTSLSSLHDSGSFGETETTKIRFAPTISVVEIPSHRDMPRDVVESVWTAVDELHQNGRRSVQEWNWDGRDWANALEEHEMIYDPTTGAYIHPATWLDMEREREEEEAMLERRLRQLELERLHQAMEEAVQREQIRIEANRKMKTKERRRRKTRRQTSPKTKFVSPKVNSRRSYPMGPIVEPAVGGSLTRFADT